MATESSEMVFVQDPANPQCPNLPKRAGPDQIPDHVPPELILDAGLITGAEYLQEPHDYMAAMHEKFPPVFYNVSPFGNSWILTKHEDCLHVLRNAETFRNLEAAPFPRDPNDYFFFIPQEIDPPHHRKYRNIVDPLFCPAGVAKLEGKIRQRAGDLIDQFAAKGECEFTTAFGRPLPVSVFLDIMGLPQDMLPTFVEWADIMIHSQDPAEVGMAFGKAIAYLKGAIAEKKANPDEGVISLIANASIDGRPLSDKEVFGFVCFLWIGGLDTVYATLNNIWLWLARNPDRVQEIIDRPGDMHKIVEELLRRYSVTFSSRYVTHDIELRGVRMKAGDRVMTCLPAANFDPDVFPDPLKVDFDRPRKTILAFTVGVHSCMGGHLARLELRVALEEWLKRIPRFSVKPGTEIAYKPGGVVGPAAVPLVW
ncbi:cytochrome P450 [Novosphingobium album (ex Hu et al. 2023)]|uniref:Cytochrome P450 n=1 Tax=Novosphingobium album (ex Hu et al. 2023) TaxID=2930093 RepID=A0ABT0B7I0_9SPHN|nr:cytochrome P450 [Novosphingobium album (ex Hu et al. 2023)]MCJ2180840.1 cytochrome P450 [Novosphingobium album (ex Hu et al. 2023)]